MTSKNRGTPAPRPRGKGGTGRRLRRPWKWFNSSPDNLMQSARNKIGRWIGPRRWQLFLALLPFAYVAAVTLPHPFGLGLQHGNDFQAHRIWWTDLATWYLKQGFVPLWTPSLDFGTVFFGHYGHGFFYAPGWWLHPLHAPAIPALQTWSHYLQICLHMGVALTGVFTLLRRRGALCEPAAAVGASLLLLNHRFHDFVRYPDGIEAMAWLPWMLVVGLRLAEGGGDPRDGVRRRLDDFLKLALLTGLSWTAGYGQLTYVGGMVIALAVLAVTVEWRGLAAAAGAAVLGTLLAAGPLGPTAVMARLSAERGGGNFSFATQNPLNVSYLDMLAHPFAADVHASSFFPPVFLGLVGGGLLVAWTRERRRLSAALLAGALLMLDLARGADGFLCRLAYDHLPMYSAFRIQSRNNWITLLALCWFAGLGAEVALKGGPRGRRVTLGPMALFPVLIALRHVLTPEPAAAVFSPAALGEMPDALQSYSFWMLTAGTTLLLLVAAGFRNGVARAVALTGMVWVFVFFFGRHSTWYRPPPSMRVHPSFVRGMLTPYRIGFGLTSQCLVDDRFTAIFREYRKATAPGADLFPASRFAFLPDDAAAGGGVTLRLDSYGPNHLRARVETAAAGRLLYFNTRFPGWRGSPAVDEAPGPFQRFMCFRLPAGKTALELSFAPPWMIVCGLVTLLGVPAVAGSLCWRRGRRKTALVAVCVAGLSSGFFLYGSYNRNSLPDRALYGLDGSTLDPAGRVPVVLGLEPRPGLR